MSVMLEMLRMAAFWAMAIRDGAGMLGGALVGIGRLLAGAVRIDRQSVALGWYRGQRDGNKEGVVVSFVNKGGVDVGMFEDKAMDQG